MSSAMVPLRDEAGHFQPGGPTPNSLGLNQFSPGLNLKRRISLAIEAELDARPECVTSFAEKFATALHDPEEHLEFLKLMRGRIEEALGEDDAQPTSRLEAEGRSEATWLRLAEEFGRRHAEPAGVVIETDPLPGRGAE